MGSFLRESGEWREIVMFKLQKTKKYVGHVRVGQELTQKWREVRELVPKRDAILQAEMVRQQNNERLREQFAAKANSVGQWLEARLDQVASLGLQKGTLEDHIKTLHSLEDEVAGYRPHLDELEKYNQEVQEALVFDNPHTPYTMEVSCLN